MAQSYRTRRLNCIGGASALGEPTGPNGFWTAWQLPPKALQATSIGLPKSGLAGLLLSRIGELVCRLWFQEAAACTVSPCTTFAIREVSMPLMRKFWALVLKKMLPTTPGLKNATCTLSQFSR